MMILGVLLASFGLLFLIISSYNSNDKELNLILRLSAIIAISAGISIIGQSSYKKGEVVGAYKMMRGKYNISYVVSQDSVITDTIIIGLEQ